MKKVVLLLILMFIVVSAVYSVPIVDRYSMLNIYNIKEWGCTGNGIHDDTAAFTTAITKAANNILFVPKGTYKLTDNVTVDSTVTIKFSNAAKISIATAKTFTINGKLEAGLSQIFSGAGTVVIAKGGVEKIVPQWWGAVGDGTADDTVAIQSALTCAGLKTKHVYLPPGIYKTTAPLVLNYGSVLEGAGKSDITTIKVTGGGNGIEVNRVADTAIYEGAKLSDFRIYSTTTPVAGVGILITADRSVDVRDVWIGSWYPATSAYGYGFVKGIQVSTQPSYHNCFSRLYIFRCTYGIMIDGGCNENRVLDSEIWYCGYGVYTGNTQTVRIINNSIEQFTTAGVYTNATEPIITNNRFESSGIQPVILGASCTLAHIENNTNILGMGNSDPVLNNSGTEYHRLQEYQYPVGYSNSSNGLAGLITADLYNYAATDMNIEAVRGDLRFKTRPIGRVIEFQSSIEADNSLNSPYGGLGDQVSNLILNSEQIGNWGDWGSGTCTHTHNVGVAPDGTLTADKIIASDNSTGVYALYDTPVIKDVVVFSVWLRTDSDTPKEGRLYLAADNNTKLSKVILIENTWKRFTASFIMEATPTYGYCIICPLGTYPFYAWGGQCTTSTAITGTENSGIHDKTDKLIDTTKNFIASGIDIGGLAYVTNVDSGLSGRITDINSTLAFTTGATAQPAVGATITGGTSNATAVIVNVVISSGTFLGENAAGYFEIDNVIGTLVAEAITWTGGSAASTNYYPNDVLIFPSLTPEYGAKVVIDTGNTYNVCSSKAIAPKPYIKTGASAICPGIQGPAIGTSNLVVGEDIAVQGTMQAIGGYLRQVWNMYPASTGAAIPDGIEFIVVDPVDGARILNFEYLAHEAGAMFCILNISSTYTITVTGPACYLGPGEALITGYDGTYWRNFFLGQWALQKNSDVTFGGLKIYDTSVDHTLAIKPNENLTANKTLNIVTGDSDRTITLSGSPSMGDYFDQPVKQASTPTFAGLGIGTTILTNALSIGGDAARVVALERITATNSAGSNLTVQAGGATALMVATVSVTAGGVGYYLADVLTLAQPSGGTSATVTVATIAATGGLRTVVPVDAGTGYADGAHVLTVVQGGASGGTLNCTASGGVITSINSVATIGIGYSISTPLATTGGGNNDFTVNITAINGAVATVTVTTKGSGYTTGTKTTTVAPAGGTGCTINVATLESATNKAAGNLLLKSGVSTGTGTGAVQIWTSPAGASGAVDNTLVQTVTVASTGVDISGALTLTTPLGTAYGGSVATQTVRFHPAEFTPSPDAVNNSCTVSVGYDRTNYRNYFEVTSGSATQDYDMVAVVKLPTDFVSFVANAISVDIYTIDYATSVATVTVYKNDNSVDVNASSVIATANTAWQTKTVAPATTGYVAGDNVKILFHIGTGDTASDYVRIARVYYTYNTR